MKSAGNVELFIARLMVTLPSSSGWREVERGRSKGNIAIHGGSLESLGSLRFWVFGPVHMEDPPCLDLPDRRPKGSAIT
jgi:hypothetical protein